MMKASKSLVATWKAMPTITETPPKVLKSIGKIYQKAQAFDIIKEHRDQLSDINRRLQAMAKSTAKGQGAIMSQLLGQKSQIEKTIESIFASVK